MTVRLSRLANGLRVVSDDMPHLETASVGIWVDAGARHELAHEHGIAHFLEHMAFKGTSRRSARQIAEAIEAVGGDLNAATSLESTAYFARILKDDLPLALDVLADILLNPVFDAAEMVREKEVIAQEIAAVNDTPDDLVFDFVQETAFPGQPVGRPVLGTVETVGGFTRDALLAYRDRHYHPGSMVLGATGAVDHDQLVEMAERLFGHLGAGRQSDAARATYVGGERSVERDTEQVHVVLAFEGTSYHDPDVYTAQVLANALGGGMSSRLFQAIREDRGLAYSIFAFASSYRDTGLFGIYSATSPDRFDELMAATNAEIAAARDGLEAEEVDRARAQLKAGLMMSLESSGARLEQIARQVIAFDRVVPVAEIVERIDAIDPDAVRAYTARLVTGSASSMSSVGPAQSLANSVAVAESFSS